jgi:shikimate dehydrogenase
VNFLVNDLANFIYSFRNEFVGYSVTMPFKQAIVPFLDKIDDQIKGLNVVNTIIKYRNKLVGYNTDFLAIRYLLKKLTSLRNKRVIILGTGSMAKTLGYAAVINGARTTIIGRSYQKAKTLACELGCECASFDHILLKSADVLLNGTSVGMNQEEVDRIIPQNIFNKEMIALDVVYNPNRTQFIKDAEHAGCNIVEGDDLFDAQAKFQSKLFLESLYE